MTEDLARLGNVVGRYREHVRLGLPDFSILYPKEAHRHPERRRFVRIGEAQHIDPAGPTADDMLAVEQGSEPLQGVAQVAGPLVLLGPGGRAHLLFQDRLHLGPMAPEDLRGVFGPMAVLLVRDRPDARRAADTEVVVQTRLPREANATSELEGVREELLHPAGLAGADVRSEEEGPRSASGPPDEQQARMLFAHREGQVREGPVVLEEGVERGLILLDQTGFEKQGFPLARGRNELDARALGEDRPVLLDAGPQVVQHPAPEAPGLPDVDDRSLR